MKEGFPDHCKHSMRLLYFSIENSHDSVSSFGITSGEWKTAEPLCGVEALLQRVLASN